MNEDEKKSLLEYLDNLYLFDIDIKHNSLNKIFKDYNISIGNKEKIKLKDNELDNRIIELSTTIPVKIFVHKDNII
jgi:hypothetical protein